MMLSESAMASVIGPGRWIRSTQLMSVVVNSWSPNEASMSIDSMPSTLTAGSSPNPSRSVLVDELTPLTRNFVAAAALIPAQFAILVRAADHVDRLPGVVLDGPQVADVKQTRDHCHARLFPARSVVLTRLPPVESPDHGHLSDLGQVGGDGGPAEGAG